MNSTPPARKISHEFFHPWENIFIVVSTPRLLVVFPNGEYQQNACLQNVARFSLLKGRNAPDRFAHFRSNTPV